MQSKKGLEKEIMEEEMQVIRERGEQTTSQRHVVNQIYLKKKRKKN